MLRHGMGDEPREEVSTILSDRDDKKASQEAARLTCAHNSHVPCQNQNARNTLVLGLGSGRSRPGKFTHDGSSGNGQLERDDMRTALRCVHSTAPVSAPIPEPSTFLILSLGLLGIAVVKKRRGSVV